MLRLSLRDDRPSVRLLRLPGFRLSAVLDPGLVLATGPGLNQRTETSDEVDEQLIPFLGFDLEVVGDRVPDELCAVALPAQDP